MATMFPCPNCGGQLRFSPSSQKLKCVSCGTFQDPREYHPDEKMGVDKLNTKIYTCPTCGGEIQLIDNDGMEFCPYCGNQSTMQEHFSETGAPKYILPFYLDKDAVREKYKEKTKKVSFVPDGLDNDENIDKLVGLYVPYHIYEYTITDDFTYDGRYHHTSGQYDITDYAKVKVRVDIESLKVPFDASQTLDDTIASQVEPFPMDEILDFNPNYLSGFFVENSTVDKDLYSEDAHDRAINTLCEKVISKGGEFKPTGNVEDDITSQIEGDLKGGNTEGAYLPLYFITTRQDDRVAYSIINGVTGTVFMDMPIDKRKLFNKAIIVSAIIFAAILLASFIFDFSFKIKNVTSFSGFVSSLIALIGAILANKAYRKDNHLDDKGFFKSKENLLGKNIKKKKGKVSNVVYSSSMIVLAFIIFSLFTNVLKELIVLVVQVLWPISIILAVVSLFKVKKGKKKVMLLGLLGWFISLVIRIIDLPNDIYYYGALIVAFVVILMATDAIIGQYNLFATRPSPQFNKMGGGLERAN